MKIRQFCLSAFLATNGLILSSGMAQALTWNFTYSAPLMSEIGSGSLSYNGSGDGTFNITSLSIVSGSNSWNFVANPSFPDRSVTLGNQQITISNNVVTDWQFAGENPSGSGFNFGKYFTKNFDFSGNGNAVTHSNAFARYSSSMTPQSQPPSLYYPSRWDGQPNATIQFSSVAVPWEFSPELGFILGLPLFLGLRMLKKKINSKIGKKQIA